MVSEKKKPICYVVADANHCFRRRVQIPKKILLILIALLFQLSTASQLELFHYQTCIDKNGYEIVRKHVYLSEGSFKEQVLTDYFIDTVPSNFKGELYIVASSDLIFLQGIYSLPLSTRDQNWLYPFDVPIPTKSPLAYFYRIRGNMFYQFRDLTGTVRWVLLEGENVLDRTFDGVELRYAGQSFGAMADKTECKDFGRNFTFVTEEFQKVDEALFFSIADFYDRMFARSPGFHLNVYGSFREANRIEKYVFPPLGVSEEKGRGFHRSWSYFSTGKFRKLQFYEGMGVPPVRVVELPPRSFSERH